MHCLPAQVRAPGQDGAERQPEAVEAVVVLQQAGEAEAEADGAQASGREPAAAREQTLLAQALALAWRPTDPRPERRPA